VTTRTRVRGWLRRWKPITPLLVAEVVALTGFAALLPVLPLYISEQGIDMGTVGLILAAWPGARLVCEPIFGFMADRTARRPFLLGGVFLMAVFAVLPVVFTTALALFALRFLYGVAVAMYEPAARGFLVDSTEEGERGEAFGLYSAAGMLGLVLGPVIGSFGTSVFGGYGFVFLFSGLMHLLSGAYLFIALPEHKLTPGAKRTRGIASSDGTDLPGHVEPVGGAAGWATEREHDWPPSGLAARGGREPGGPVESVEQAPLRDLANPSFAGAVLMNFGFYFSVGVYEVIWSLYMRYLGASIEWIGFTFTLFGLPVLLIGPFAGRIVDRIGALPFAALGGLAIAGTGVAYTFATEPTQPVPFLLIEATGWAFSGPALFAILARGTPRGRSSTAQGFFGSSGTLAFVIASSVAGALFAMNPRYPFYFFVGVTLAATGLGVALVVLGDRWRDRSRRQRELATTGQSP
jgi:MFS family permease